MKFDRKFLLLSIFLTSGLLSAQSSDLTWVGVVRGDGLLQLIARFNGKTWSGLPPLPTWEDKPRLSDQWFFWPTSDTTVRKLMVGERVHFEDWDHQITWAFLTDYCPRDVGSIFVPYPKVGFALDRQTNAVPIITLDTLSEDWQKLRPQVLSLFEKIETQALSQEPAKHRYLLTTVPKQLAERQTFPTILQHLSRTKLTMNNKHVYRFELIRYYPSGGCVTIAALQGWVISVANKLFVVNEDFSFGDCDGKGLNATLRPIGVFELNKRTFLVIEGSGYEGEYYLLSELIGDGIITLVEPE